MFVGYRKLINVFYTFSFHIVVILIVNHDPIWLHVTYQRYMHKRIDYHIQFATGCWYSSVCMYTYMLYLMRLCNMVFLAIQHIIEIYPRIKLDFVSFYHREMIKYCLNSFYCRFLFNEINFNWLSSILD